jgi:hypothetical protein
LRHVEVGKAAGRGPVGSIAVSDDLPAGEAEPVEFEWILGDGETLDSEGNPGRPYQAGTDPDYLDRRDVRAGISTVGAAGLVAVPDCTAPDLRRKP